MIEEAPTFTDADGNTWTIIITVAELKAIKRHAGIDLCNMLAADAFARLATDAILLGDVLYLACRQECDRRRISDEQFGRGLRGDVIDRATDALLEALVNFSPTPQRKRLGQVVKQVRAQICAALEREASPPSCGASSTGPPASAISTPTPSHCASCSPWPKPPTSPP